MRENKSIKNSLTFVGTIILGLILRCALAPYTSDSCDVEVWYKLTSSLIYGAGIYELMYWSYPPISAYIFGFFTKIAALFFNPANFAIEIPELYPTYRITGGILKNTITSPIFNFSIKLPLIIADLLISYILYKFIYEITHNIKKAKCAFILFFLNPLVITVSSLHGAMEPIVTLFLVLMAFHLFKRNYFFTGIFWIFSILTKLLPIYFLPLMITLIILQEAIIPKPKKRLPYIIRNLFFLFFGVLVGFAAIFVPLCLYEGFSKFNLCLFKGRFATGINIGGFNLFFIIFLPQFKPFLDYARNNTPTLVKTCSGTMLFFLSYFATCQIRSSQTSFIKHLTLGFLYTLGTIYLFTPLVGPRFLYWIIPFLILYILLFNISFKKIFHLFSLLGVIYYFAVKGWSLFLPLATYTNLISVKSMSMLIQNFWYYPGLLNRYLREDFLLVSSSIGVIIIILIIILSIHDITTNNN